MIDCFSLEKINKLIEAKEIEKAINIRNGFNDGTDDFLIEMNNENIEYKFRNRIYSLLKPLNNEEEEDY